MTLRGARGVGVAAEGMGFHIIGCGDGPAAPVDVELSVRTDKSAYSLASDDGASVVLVNHGPGAVYAPMNEYVYVERLEAGKWRDRRPWFAVDGIGVSFPVPAGDSLVEGMSFSYVDRRPGTYRFVFEVALDPSGRRLVPDPQAASPPFELRP